MRILLIDNEELFRQGLRALLSNREDCQVVGEAATARTGQVIAQQANPEIIVIDIRPAGAGGPASIRELSRHCPSAKILVLTAWNDGRLLGQALHAGASAVVFKTSSLDELMQAMSTAMSGRRHLPPALRKELLLEGLRVHDEADPLSSLSAREKEVFDLICRGRSTKDAARELCVSGKTIETHRSRINAKLGVRSTADLIRFAAANGLLDPGAAAFQKAEFRYATQAAEQGGGINEHAGT